MIHILAAFLLWTNIVALLDATPAFGLPDIMKESVGLGFAVLFWFALTKSYKDHRADLNERDRIHSDRVAALMERQEQREERLMGILQANVEMKGRLVEVMENCRATREAIDKR